MALNTIYQHSKHINIPMINRIFRSFSHTDSKKSNNPHHSQPMPDSICNRILDLEIQCEQQTVSKQTVFDLLAQYTKAIQFYEEKGNHKYQLYEKRMQNFMRKPLVEQILKGKTGKVIVQKQNKQLIKLSAQDRAQIMMRQMLEEQEKMRKKQKKSIEQELIKQEEAFEKRRRNRRAISNTSATNSSMLTNDESDINEGTTQKFTQYDDMINIKDFLVSLGEKKRKDQQF